MESVEGTVGLGDGFGQGVRWFLGLVGASCGVGLGWGWDEERERRER